MSSRDPDSPETTLERLISERRGKAVALRAHGVDPYRNDVGPTTSLGAVRTRYAPTKPETPASSMSPIDGDVLRVAGRVMNKRVVSKKLVFAPIRDTSGDLQLFINIEHLAAEDYEKVLPQLD